MENLTARDQRPWKPRVAALAAVAGCALAVLIVGGLVATGDGSWEIWQEHGQWEVSDDRRTVRTEQSSECWEQRVRIVERTPADRWRVQFERRHKGQFCELAGCISLPDDMFSCGAELRLPERIPEGTDVWASCSVPNDSDAGQVGRSPQTTSGPGVAAICSESPEAS